MRPGQTESKSRLIGFIDRSKAGFSVENAFAAVDEFDCTPLALG
jgi:hypothetical protein